MRITRHAARRIQQRGFTQTELDLIYQYGVEIQRPGGAIEYLFTRKSASELARDVKKYRGLISKLRGKALLFCNGELLTAYYRSRKSRH